MSPLLSMGLSFRFAKDERAVWLNCTVVDYLKGFHVRAEDMRVKFRAHQLETELSVLASDEFWVLTTYRSGAGNDVVRAVRLKDGITVYFMQGGKDAALAPAVVVTQSVPELKKRILGEDRTIMPY